MYTIGSEKYHYHELMRELNTLALLKEENGTFRGLLRNHPNAADWFYNAPYGEIVLAVTPRWQHPEYHASIRIHSIDDTSIFITGPIEAQDKAHKRLLLAKKHVGSWNGWIPDQTQIHELCRDTNMYWNR